MVFSEKNIQQVWEKAKITINVRRQRNVYQLIKKLRDSFLS